METELTQVTEPVGKQTLDANLVAKSTSELEALITAEESKPATTETVTPAAETVVKAEGTENKPAEQIPATVQPPVTPPIQPVTEQPKVDEVKTFLEKKHLTEQDVPKLVNMYSNLEKEFSRKSQELASLKKQEQAVPTQAPVLDNTSMGIPAPIQEQFLADLQRDPIGTVDRLIQLRQGPVIGNLESIVKNQQLHNTVVSLSTNPETAEFNLPIVQEEIKRVIEENPYMTSDLAKNIPVANDIAIGRLYRQGKLNRDAVGAGIKMAEQRVASAGASIPASSKPPAPVAEKPFSEMTPSELEQLMAKMKVM